MFKITHMKKAVEEQYVFRRDFRVRQGVSDEIQTSISFIKHELQNSIDIIYLLKNKGTIVLVEW